MRYKTETWYFCWKSVYQIILQSNNYRHNFQLIKNNKNINEKRNSTVPTRKDIKIINANRNTLLYSMTTQ